MTRRKLEEEAERLDQTFAEMLIEGAPTLVAVLDVDAKLLWCNRYVERITGYRVDEVVGVDAVEMFVVEEKHAVSRQHLRTLAAGMEAVGMTIPILTKEGNRREVEWTSRALRDVRHKTLCILIIGRDITDLKLAQQRTLQAERLAAIGQMVTGLAHESGNALQRSQACLEMLALEVQDQPTALHLVSRIQLAQDHLKQLYEEVRSYAAPIVLREVPAQPVDLVRQAWADLEPTWIARDVCLEIADGTCGACQVDVFAMQRVFRNILENSLAACADPVQIDVSWTETQLNGRAALSIRLRDNGPGLDVQQRQNLFEPFYTTKTKGTGLGLAISKRIVEAHGGVILAGQQDGPGAEIVVTLPGVAVD